MVAMTAREGVWVVLASIYFGTALSWDLMDTFEAWKSQIPSLQPSDIRQGKQIKEGEEVVVQRITLLTVTSTAVIGTHPKVTAAPVIKRKLGSSRWDAIHEGIQAQKRNGETCPKDYELCPKSLNGGCCPNDRVCGASGCLPASTTIALACGKQNYFACDLEHGGGCCPNNHECGKNGCTPLPGATSTMTCGVSSYLCPASVNYGCCQIGMGCGIENCYSTGASTFTITQTITTTDANSNTRTLTTTITSTTTPFVPEQTTGIAAGVVPKVSAAPISIPKINATSSSESSGLTKAQLGGIIGGAVGLLLVLLIAAFIIIRRLNKAIKMSSTPTRSKASNDASTKPRPTPLDLDAMSVDPLMITPSEIGGTPKLPSPHSTPFEVDSSPVFRGTFSPREPPYTIYQRGYNVVSTSDAASSWNRHGSMESTASMGQTQAGYFDIQPQDGRRPSHHARQWSNASDGSMGSQESMVELDAGVDGHRRASFQRALLGMGRVVSRRRSESLPQLTGGPVRVEGSQPAGTTGGPGSGMALGQTLGHIPEAGESRIQVGMHAQQPGGEGAGMGPTRREAYG